MTYNIITRLSDPNINSKLELITYLIKRAEKQNQTKNLKV